MYLIVFIAPQKKVKKMEIMKSVCVCVCVLWGGSNMVCINLFVSILNQIV